MEEKEYAIMLRSKCKEHFLHDLKTDNTTVDHIPCRCVEISDECNNSRRYMYIMLTEQEADNLKSHPEVEFLFQSSSEDLPTHPCIEKTTTSRQESATSIAGYNSWNIGFGDNVVIQESEFRHYSPKPVANSLVSHGQLLDGTGVDVVVVDSGVTENHPCFLDENGNTRIRKIDWGEVSGINTGHVIEDDFKTEQQHHINGSTYGPQYHGTHCAATACGRGFGYATGAHIYSIGIYNNSSGNMTNATNAIHMVREWHDQKPIDATTGLKRPTIVSLSLGSSSDIDDLNKITSLIYRGAEMVPQFSDANSARDYGVRTGGCPVRSSNSDLAVVEAIDAGVIIVHSAGNDGYYMDVEGGQDYNNRVVRQLGTGFTLPDGEVVYPPGSQVTNRYHQGSSPRGVGDKHAITVGALDFYQRKVSGQPNLEQRASFSNCGPAVDIYAPGTKIVSAGWYPNGLVDMRPSLDALFTADTTTGTNTLRNVPAWVFDRIMLGNRITCWQQYDTSTYSNPDGTRVKDWRSQYALQYNTFVSDINRQSRTIQLTTDVRAPFYFPFPGTPPPPPQDYIGYSYAFATTRASQGTSMACPFITGLVALFLQLNPGANQIDCLNWIQNSCVREGDVMYTDLVEGVINYRDSRSTYNSHGNVVINPYAHVYAGEMKTSGDD